MAGNTSDALLEVRGITKRFGGTRALDGVDLLVAPGQIHALVGENGAGKSTLIKILAGLFAPDGGEILFRGAPSHPHVAPLPIHFVHQDLGLFDDLSVGENVAMVTGFPRRHGLIEWSAVWKEAREIYTRLDLEPPDPRLPVRALGAAGKAILGIARALAQQSVILVLDEPTAALPEPDAQKLFGVLRQLRKAGTGMLYVSHRLRELFPLADCVTVLRDGRRVRHAGIDAFTPEQLIADMLGQPLDREDRKLSTFTGPPILEVENLEIAHRPPLSFSVRPGEILGLVGLRGGGQRTIGRAIFGAHRAHAGAIRVNGRKLSLAGDIAERIAAGVSLLPGDRAEESTLPGLSVRENLFPDPGIRHASPWGRVSPAEERRRTADVLERFDVRPRNGEAIIDWLSGGNQQKVFVARWLTGGCKLVVLEEPTAGVDIGAKFEIHAMIRALAKPGAGVVVVSSDFEEVTSVCHRALVVSHGTIVKSLEGPDLTVDGLLAFASGPSLPSASSSEEADA